MSSTDRLPSQLASEIYTRKNPFEIMAKLQQKAISESGWLIIPRDIVRAKGWRKGDEFLVMDAPNGVKSVRGDEAVKQQFETLSGIKMKPSLYPQLIAYFEII